MGWKTVTAMCAMSVLCAPVGAMADDAASTQPVLSSDGFGSIRLGIRSEGSGAWLEGHPTPGCYGGYFPGRAGPHLIFEHDRLARIAIRGVQDIQTARGIHIGSTEDDVRHAYGAQLVMTPSPSFAPPGKTLTVWLHHHTQGIRFDTDTSKRVVSMIAGTPSIMRGANCP